METSEPVNVVSKPAMSDSMEAEVAGDALADAVPGAGKWDAHRNDSAETIAVPDDLGTLQQIPQLQQSDDHIAVIKRLLFEIRELQTQVQGMSAELRQTRMANASLRAAVKTRDEEALRNAEERAESKKTIEGLKQVVKGLREAWAQERKRAARSEPSMETMDYSGAFYQSQSGYGRYDNRQYPQQVYQGAMAQLPPPIPPQAGYSHIQGRNVWGPPQPYPQTAVDTAFRSASISSFSSNEDYSPRSFGSNA